MHVHISNVNVSLGHKPKENYQPALILHHRCFISVVHYHLMALCYRLAHHMTK